MEQQNQKLRLREKIGYGFGDLASCLFWATIMSQLLFFYTDIFGLTGKAAGIMFFVSRILDAVFDVVIGMTADRTKSRWGKFRPYLLWGGVPLAVAAVMTFTTPEFGEAGKLIYAYATFIVFMFLYSTINIPYTALLGVISGDPVERTSASSFKFTGAYLGGFIVSATVLPLAAHFGHESVAKGWQMTMSIYGIAAIIFFFITFISTHERIQPIAKEKTSVKDDLKDLSKNTPWILLFAVTILFILFTCIRMSVTTHYFNDYIGEQSSPLLTHIYNFLLTYLLNPMYALFGAQASSLLDDAHKYGYEVLTSIFNTLGQGISLVGGTLSSMVYKSSREKECRHYSFHHSFDLYRIILFPDSRKLDIDFCSPTHRIDRRRPNFCTLVGSLCGHGRLFRMENRQKGDRTCFFSFYHVD